jgi:hypothetical protein
MPHGSVTETIPASSAEVFRLLHDYDRRLEWDTLLRDARLCAPWTEAQLHATSVCTGRWYLGGLALKTEYISFKPPQVAAVRMLNRPPFFAGFAATIRHRDLNDDASSVEYKYTFTARPSWLRWLLHPVMAALFRWETRKRLRALRGFFAERADHAVARPFEAAASSHGPEPAAGSGSNVGPPPPAR